MYSNAVLHENFKILFTTYVVSSNIQLIIVANNVTPYFHKQLKCHSKHLTFDMKMVSYKSAERRYEFPDFANISIGIRYNIKHIGLMLDVIGLMWPMKTSALKNKSSHFESIRELHQNYINPWHILDFRTAFRNFWLHNFSVEWWISFITDVATSPGTKKSFCTTLKWLK